MFRRLGIVESEIDISHIDQDIGTTGIDLQDPSIKDHGLSELASALLEHRQRKEKIRVVGVLFDQMD